MQYRRQAIAKLKSRTTEAEVMEHCPLNYNCELMCETVVNEFTGEKTCTNESTCEQYSLSWGLPYEYYPEKKLLIVQDTRFRYFWDKEVLRMDRRNWNCKVCPIDGMIAGNYTVASSSMPFRIGTVSIHEQMRIELKEAGWMPAVSIKKPVTQLSNFEGFGILGNGMRLIYPDLRQVKPIEIKREFE